MATTITKVELEKKLKKVETELEEFKNRVVETAQEFADENGYCSDSVTDFLERLNLELPLRRMSVTVAFSLEAATEDDIDHASLSEFLEIALEDYVRDNNPYIRKPEQTRYTGHPDYKYEKTGKKSFDLEVVEVFAD